MKTLKISLIFFLLLNIGLSSQTKPKASFIQEIDKAITEKRAKDLEIIKKLWKNGKIWNPFR
mgnify:CR=1 FL=1